MKTLATPLHLVLCILVVTGCASNRGKVLDSGTSQVEVRSYQTRAFDTTDREKTLRTVIATLQDLEFMIEDANALLGTVSANKALQPQFETRMTVSIRPRGETQLLVRASLQYLNKPVHEPGPYQQFFAALEKAMFLTAHGE